MKNTAVILGNTNLNYSWFVLTFRQGLQKNDYEVIDIDYKSTPLHKIYSQLVLIKPKYVFTHLSFHAQVNPIQNVLQMYSDVNIKVGTKFIHTCNDARKTDRFVGDLRGAFNAAFVGSIDMLQNCPPVWNIPVFYTPYSSLCYDKMAIPAADLLFNEAVFTGSPGSHPDRRQFLDKLSKKIPIKIFHTQSGADLRPRTPELSISARCILGLCTGYDILGYVDVRPFQYLGTGACMIMRKFPGMESLIPDDLYYGFNSYDEIGVNQATEHYNKICKTNTLPMQQKAFDYIQQNHNCKVRIAYVLEKLKDV